MLLILASAGSTHWSVDMLLVIGKCQLLTFRGYAGMLSLVGKCRYAFLRQSVIALAAFMQHLHS